MIRREADRTRHRVAIVATTDFHGGAELYVNRLARALEQDGTAVTLYGSLKDYSGTVTPLQHGPKWSLRTLPRGLVRARRERASLIANLDPSEESFSLHFKREQIAFTRALARRGRVVWTEHGTFPDGLFGIMISGLYRVASRHAAEIVCVSEVVASSIRRRASKRTIVSVIETAIPRRDTALSKEEARTKLGLALDDTVCVFAGRLTPEKRPDLAVKMAIGTGAILLLAGEGPLSAQIREEARGHANIRLLGQVPDMTAAFAAADFHLWMSTGRGEGFPTVLLEAAQAGSVTVAVAGTAFEQLVREAGGRVGDLRSLSHQISFGPTVAELSTMQLWVELHDPSNWIRKYRAALLNTTNTDGERE